MNSVGHTLKIDVVNFPELDNDAEIVGSAEIYIASRDYLRFPFQNLDEKEKRKRIKLSYVDPFTKQLSDSGQIEIGISFNFDAQRVRKDVDSEEEGDIL